MTKEFNSLQEIEKYYDEQTNTYVFTEDGKYIDLVKFNFDLKIDSSINAYNIDAYNIMARNINALDINAGDIDAVDINARNIDVYNIKANNISYYAVCYAYKNIKCKSIKGIRINSKHFVLDGKLEVEDK